ncbi:MAG: hypothetical protein ACD_46C00083G0007 [uncultured bacterium]|nr:MAG: hypothetical protein ACD_46C00083G0007 [uncultured bacterium]
MKDTQELDNCLQQTIKYLMENWYKEETGIVACALKDSDKIVFATSSKNGKNWSHAERNAYNKFKHLYGEPSEDAAFVITLSPCVEQLKYRSESSCAELIRLLGVRRMHFGVIDTLHVSSISSYAEMGFIATLTKNNRIALICDKLMSLFSRYDSRINSELLKIKKELGDGFFS